LPQIELNAEVVVIDCPPHTGAVSKAAITISDHTVYAQRRRFAGYQRQQSSWYTQPGQLVATAGRRL